MIRRYPKTDPSYNTTDTANAEMPKKSPIEMTRYSSRVFNQATTQLSAAITITWTPTSTEPARYAVSPIRRSNTGYSIAPEHLL